MKLRRLLKNATRRGGIMSKTLFLDIEEIGPKLIDNTQLRNVRIITYYEALQDFNSGLKYAEKVRMMAKKFGLSGKSIEGIICQYTEKHD